MTLWEVAISGTFVKALLGHFLIIYSYLLCSYMLYRQCASLWGLHCCIWAVIGLFGADITLVALETRLLPDILFTF